MTKVVKLRYSHVKYGKKNKKVYSNLVKSVKSTATQCGLGLASEISPGSLLELRLSGLTLTLYLTYLIIIWILTRS